MSQSKAYINLQHRKQVREQNKKERELLRNRNATIIQLIEEQFIKDMAFVTQHKIHNGMLAKIMGITRGSFSLKKKAGTGWQQSQMIKLRNFLQLMEIELQSLRKNNEEIIRKIEKLKPI